MALEDSVPVGLALLSFLPTFIASSISDERIGFKILKYALYTLSIFLALLCLQSFSLFLSRAFGGSPTSTESSILSIVTYFNVPILTYLILFAMLIGLGIIMYLIDYLQSRTFGKTK